MHGAFWATDRTLAGSGANFLVAGLSLLGLPVTDLRGHFSCSAASAGVAALFCWFDGWCWARGARRTG